MKKHASPDTDSNAPLVCRAMVAAPDTAADAVQFMPAGTHTINPGQNGKSVTLQVLVNRETADAIEAQRREVVARNKRPFFDFNHRDEEASFWPSEFFWQDGPDAGVYARGEWSKAGREAIEGKAWRQFSPVFHVDSIRNKPAKVVTKPDASPNFGGFVNKPAFRDISPLWARETDTTSEGSGEVIAREHYDALRVEMEALRAKHEAAEGALMARQAFEIQAAVNDAVARGAIAARDFKTQESFIAAATADPTFLEAIRAMKGNMALELSGITRAATNAAGQAGLGGRTPGTYRVV